MKETSLAKIYDESNNESLETLAQNVKGYFQSEDQKALEAISTELNKRPALISFFFPGKIEKENQEITIQTMREQFKNRQEMLRIYMDILTYQTKIEGEMLIKAKTQHYEGRLSQQAMQIRTELTAFSQTKIDEMTSIFKKSRVNFSERVDEQFSAAEKYKGKNDFLYQQFTESLHKETALFFGTIETLLTDFKEDLKNKLDKTKVE